MRNHQDEPTSSGAVPRPCSTPVLSEVEGPHSAPVAWLKETNDSSRHAELTDLSVRHPEPDSGSMNTMAASTSEAEIVDPHLRQDDALKGQAPAHALPTVRHDGWTGEKIAIFCETLAETAVVAEACEAARMGISGAYAARRRNPVFAAAWDAALAQARERLADTLLARSMEGNIEQIWRDGEVVGERHVIDNRLGLAILKRLDRLAESRITFGIHGERTTAVRPEQSRRAPAPTPQPFDWTLAIDALRTGDEEAVCKALALFKNDEVEEVEDHHFSSADNDAPDEIDLSDRCWLQGEMGEKVWMTSFPPPRDFSGWQKCEWGDPDEAYERECTPEEVAILEADIASARAAERAEEESLRDSWFALLKEEQGVDAAGGGGAAVKAAKKPRRGNGHE